MEIRFRSKRLAKQFESEKALAKEFGQRMAEVIQRRIGAMRAATFLEELRNLPGRLHELTGNRSGQLAFDLVHPQRLIFVPDDDDEFRKADGGWDWNKVCRVIVIEVVDYHD